MTMKKAMKKITAILLVITLFSSFFTSIPLYARELEAGDIESVQSPAEAVVDLDARTITAIVSGGITEIPIVLTFVGDTGSSIRNEWKLYSDKEYKNEIASKVLPLSDGENAAYIVLNWDTDMGFGSEEYTITITKESSDDDTPIIIGNTNKEKAESIASQMTTREKIGQILTMDTLSWNGAAMTTLTDGCAKFLSDYHIGGFILYGNNVNNIEQVAELIYDIQKNGIEASRFDIPLFMTADQEGGSSSLMNMATLMPGNMALGSTADPEQAYRSGYVIGKELSTIGINVAFSTPLDVNIQPDNPVIGIRSFSSDPNLVASMGVSAIKGLTDGGVIGTVKHFPGHGNTASDSHSGMTVVPGTKEELQKTELLPFQVAIDNDVEMIMTGHLVVRGLDDSEVMATIGSSAGTMVPRPATFSHKIMTELLREEMGYEGLTITDAMNMGAIANYFAPADRVQLCLEAGIDIPLIPVRISGNNSNNIITNTIEPMFAALEQRADANGGDNDLMRSINKALVRILTYKMDRGIYKPGAAVQPYMELSLAERKEVSRSVIRSEEHLTIEKSISDKSVVLAENKVIDGKAVLPFTLKNGDSIYVLSANNSYTPHVTTAVNEIVQKTGLTDVTVTTTNYGTTANAINDTVKGRIDDATYVIIGSWVSNAASRNPNGTSANNRYASNAKAAWDYVAEKGYGSKTAGISYQLPYELSYLDYCSALVNTSSGANATTFATIQNYRSAVNVIFGYVSPTGKFPVDVPKPGTAIADNDLIRKVGDGLVFDDKPIIIGNTNKEKAESIASQMTTREKIGQVLTMDTLSWNGAAMTTLTDGCAKFLRDYHIGGFILYGNNVNNISQVAELIYDIQDNGIEASRFDIPLFMTADQEGGSSSLMNMATLMPGNMALGSTADPQQAYRSGYVIGKELSTIGINVAFSTPLDVNTQPDNPVIGIRSFSSDPNLVASMGVSAIKGLTDGGVIGTVKHFPGHGNTASDSHSGMTLVPGTKEELMKTELLPFQAAIDNGVEMIMTGHLVVRGLDDSEVMATTGSSAGTMVPRPSTFSHKIMTELLREEMGYEGLTITDAMNMGAIANYFAPADRVQLCLEAGIDIPLIPVRISGNNSNNIITNTIEPMFAALEQRADTNGGDNDLMRSLDKALIRILTYKMDRDIYVPGAEVQPYMTLSLAERKEASNAVIRSAEHLAIEKEIADKSIVLAENKVIDGKAVLPFTLKDGDSIYVLSANNNYTPHVTTAINEIVQKAGLTDVTVTTTNYGTTANAINDTVKSRIDSATYVLIGSWVSNAASRNPNGTSTNNRYASNAKAAWDYIAEKGYGSKTAGISYQLPYELSYLDYCSALVNTSSGANASTFATIQNYRSAVNVIFGYVSPTGKFPVDVPKPGTAIADNDLIRRVGDGLTFGDPVDISADDRVIINLETWPDQDSAVFNPKFTLRAKEAFDVTLYVAVYDKSGKLSAINSQSVSLAPDTAVSLQAEVSRLNDDDASYKFFIWDSKFIPLTQKTSF